MGQPFDAKLAVTHLFHRNARRIDLHERRVIHRAGHQISREAGAEARARAVRLNLMVDHAKAVFADRAVKQGLGIVARLQILRQPQGLEHILPPALTLQQLAQRHKHRMAQPRIFSPQIGIDRGADRPVLKLDPRVRVGRTRDEQKAGIFGPALRIVGDVQGGTHKGTGAQRIARRLFRGGLRQMLGRAPFSGQMAGGKTHSLIEGL